MARSSRGRDVVEAADDARERLLPSREEGEAVDSDVFTHEELLHSIGSFSAVVPPVVVTMLLARCVR
jgi:hypothetical protein